MIRNSFILGAFIAYLLSVSTHAAPDLTKGDKKPEDAKHDWNLGATGARGWMHSDKMVTTEARQIAITKVAEGSPADGVLQVGDVILGIGGKPFSHDARFAFGKALTAAESTAGEGKLQLIRWRDGKEEQVTVNLPVLGDYSATTPFGCPKSKLILERGCEALAKKIEAPNYRENPITRSLNAIALLASGEEKYLPIIKKEAEWAANYSEGGYKTWYYGYVISFLAEYVIATGDDSVMPGLRRLTLDAVKGQSDVGSWGHKFAGADGRLMGYGMMNAPGVPLTIALVLAREAGVDQPEVGQAIERSTRLLRFYVGKGSIPYGDHNPWTETHDDNGKNGMGAVLFNLLGEKEGADFFSKMSIACHGARRDGGHTGNFFNITWALPGVAQAGPNATGAWMKEYGSWYFDMARLWDYSYRHQGPPGKRTDSYSNWDCTGAYLIAYAMPLKKIHLTGKKSSSIPVMSMEEAKKLILDGHGWTNKDRHSGYDSLNGDMLFDRLSSWSPTVRERAATAISRKKNFPADNIIKLLEAPSVYSRLGACETLKRMRSKPAAAVPLLQQSLKHEDMWVRIKAVEALAAIGEPAAPALGEIMNLLTEVDTTRDPRGMQQRYIAYAFFKNNSKLLDKALNELDTALIVKAVQAVLQNEDGRARGTVNSVYKKLSPEQLNNLLPAIFGATMKPAPSGVMFADQIQVAGLELMTRERIKEGMPAIVHYLANQNKWASEKRTPNVLKLLLNYGTHARSVISDLEKVAADYADGEENFPMHLSKQKAEAVRKTIEDIKASKDTPELRSIK